jgi:hypothetical protein
LSESIIGLGGFILGDLDEPKTVDRIWHDFENIRDTDIFPSYQSFDNFVLAISFLYTIGAIRMLEEDGRLQRCG